MKLCTAVAFVAVVSAAASAAQTPPSGGVPGRFGQYQEPKYSTAILHPNPDVRRLFSGSWNGDEWRKLTTLSRPEQETLYVKTGGEFYRITDKGTIADVKKAFEPMNRVSKEMSDLGKQWEQAGKRFSEDQRKRDREAEADEKENGDGWRTSYEARMKVFRQAMAKYQKEQSGYSQQMSALGRKMGEASRAAIRRLEEVLDRAFDKGFAEKVDL